MTIPIYLIIALAGLIGYLVFLLKLMKNPTTSTTQIQECPQCHQPLKGTVKSIEPYHLEFHCVNPECPLATKNEIAKET